MKEKLNLLLLLCTKKRKRERELHISITSINQINHLPNLLCSSYPGNSSRVMGEKEKMGRRR